MFQRELVEQRFIKLYRFDCVKQKRMKQSLRFSIRYRNNETDVPMPIPNKPERKERDFWVS